MRVLAARFADRGTAKSALDKLRRTFGLAEDAAAIAPLGWPGEEAANQETVLAGRFDEHQSALVRELLTSSGGTVVADVDEAWTQARPAAIPFEPEGRSEPRPHNGGQSAARRGDRRQAAPGREAQEAR